MLRGLWGWNPTVQVPLSSPFTVRPRIRSESVLYALRPFLCLSPGPIGVCDLGDPVRVGRVLRGVGVEAVLESCFHSWRRQPSRGAG
jgi:hypothetical protein